MAQHPLINATVFFGQYDISADHNQVRVGATVEALDRTTFGQTTRIKMGGLRAGEITGSGFLDYGATAVEAYLSEKLSLNDVPITVTPTGTALDRGPFMQALVASLTPVGGTVGDMHRFDWKGETGQSPLIRTGVLMAAKAARTSSSNSGTAQQLGAVGASQKIWAALHVFAASGTTPSLAVTVKSDNSVGFGSPTTQITFTSATTATSEVKSTAGAITDDYWRVDWTISGTTPSFTFAVAIGIL